MNENFVLECIRKFPKQTGAIALDVGANYGDFTRVMAQKFDAVYSFEPHPANLVELRKATTPYLNVFIEPRAVSDVTGPMRLYVNNDNPGGHTICKRHAELQKWGHRMDNFITVDSITLDDFCEANGLQPALIKVDIEGGEDFIFSGASKLLKQPKLTIILEVHQDVDLGLAKLFQENGFKTINSSWQRADEFVYDEHYLITKG